MEEKLLLGYEKMPFGSIWFSKIETIHISKFFLGFFPNFAMLYFTV